MRVYIRDQHYSRVAQIDDFLSLETQERHLGLGTWQMEAPFGSRALDLLLTTPGSGIDMRDDTGRTVFAGPMRDWERAVDTRDGTDKVTVSGWDDMSVLHARRIHPQPDAPAPPFNLQSHYYATGTIPDIINSFIVISLGGFALAARRTPEFTVDVTPGGPSMTVYGRWQNLLEWITELAGPNNVSVTVRQRAGALKCTIRPVRDRTAVEISPRAGTLEGWVQKYTAPKVTAAWAAGTGELTDRNVRQTSVTPPALYPMRLEGFVDYRNGDISEITRKLAEYMVENAQTTSLTLNPTESLAAMYGVDFDLGDNVTVVVGGVRTVQTVTMVNHRIDEGVVTRKYNVGPENPTGPAVLFDMFRKQGSRIRNLEGI